MVLYNIIKKYILLTYREFNFGSGWTLFSSFEACKSLIYKKNLGVEVSILNKICVVHHKWME